MTLLRRVWRYQRSNQNPYIDEEQKTQWPKTKVQKDIKIKKQVGQKRSTVCTQTYADCLENMMAIKNSSMLKISISENFLVESDCFMK